MTEFPRTDFPRTCLLGHPVGFSRSAIIYDTLIREAGLVGRHDLVDVTPEDFPAVYLSLAERGYVGGNLTLPHKDAGLAYAHLRDAAATAIGAVNTVWFENGLLVGGNTDYLGVIGNLDDAFPGWDRVAGRALVLGAGGAARAAVYGLVGRGLDVAVVNRTLARAEELVERFGPRVSAHGFDALPRLLPSAGLLVNATNLGREGQPPLRISLDGLAPEAIVNDVNYVPYETDLLRRARELGFPTLNGIGMILAQTPYTMPRWYGVAAKVTPALRATLEADVRSKAS